MSGGGIREMTLQLAHRPLQAEWAQKLLYVMSVGFDANLEKLTQGVHDHMPLAAPTPTALQYSGADYQVLRGLTESDASYAFRLSRALDAWGLAGNAWTVLMQVLGYLLAKTPRAQTVQTSYDATGTPTRSVWDYFEAGAVTTSPPRHSEDSGTWNWDQYSPTTGSWGWWRWYLVLWATSPNNWCNKAPKWGGAGVKWGGYSGSWGVDVSRLVGLSIRIIVNQWKAAGPVCDWCVISFDDTAFRPGAATLPDGYYGRWSKLVGGVYVRARSDKGRYFQGPRP